MGDSPFNFPGTFNSSEDFRDLSFDVKYKGMSSRLRHYRNIEHVVNRALNSPQRRREIHEKLAKRQLNRWIRNYRSEGGEYGQPWARWNSGAKDHWKDMIVSVKIPNQRNFQGSTLLREGVQFGQHRAQMQDATTMPLGRFSGIGASWKFSNDIDSGYYAVSHHTGYTFGKKDNIVVPQRTIWDLDAKDESNAFKLFSRWAHKILLESLGN